MTRRLRFSLRAALVAALTTTMTVSPASAGWLLHRLARHSDSSVCCTPVYAVNPCPPAPCCPAPVEPICCGAMGVDGSVIGGPVVIDGGEISSDVSRGVVTDVYEGTAPAQNGLQAEPWSGSEPSPAPLTESPSDVPAPAPPQPTPEAESAAESAPTPPAAPEPETPTAPAPTPPSAPEPAAPAAPEPAAPATPEPSPFDEPQAEPAGDLFDIPAPAADGAATDDAAPATAPEIELLQEDPFGASDAPGAELPAAEAPDALEEDMDLFDTFGAPAGEEEAAESDAEATADDLFGGFGEPTEDAAEGAPAEAESAEPAEEPAADPLSDGALEDVFGNPTSTEDNAEEKAEATLFDELFGASLPRAPHSPAVAAAPATPVSVAAAKPAADPIDVTASRTWTDNTGTFSTEGRLLAVTDTHVRVLKSNGRTCTVELRRLSPSDAAYVQETLRQTASDAELFAAAR